MWETFALLLGLRAVELQARDWDAQPVVPEPEFKPFQLQSRSAAGSGAAPGAGREAPAAAGHAPRTLEELGVPGSLAAELEGSLRVMGMVDGDRIVGFTFRTPDGVLHPLRAARPAGRTSDRAA